MKTMTCNQLAGACDEQFTAETFTEIGELSKQHAVAKAAQGDAAHLAKMEEMRKLMSDPEAMQKWFQKKEAEFDALPED